VTDLSDILALLTDKLEKIGIKAMLAASYTYAPIYICF
jgi:hypothetical protein